LVVEAGDILAGEDSTRRCFANGPNKDLTSGQMWIRNAFQNHACCEQITGVQSRADRVSRDFPSAMIPDEEHLAVGIYEDGPPGEIFITTAE